jgi:hypothetical protein
MIGGAILILIIIAVIVIAIRSSTGETSGKAQSGQNRYW